MRYRDWAFFYDKSGEPGRPITLEGHGATLDGCDPLDAEGWTETEPGLFHNSDLMPLTDAIIDRWFFVMDGKLNRMNRCSKGPSEQLRTPEALKPGEWTFVKDVERTATAKAGYIHGTFWLRLPPGQGIGDAKIEVPVRMAGVAMRESCSHLVVRNVTSIRPYNDGFNLSDCQDIVFENIRAIDCGDDGISAHGACRYRVDGFASIGNATGICDTGDSQTFYRNVLIDRCIGFDLYFLDTGQYSVSDAYIRSTSSKPLYLQGRDAPAGPCTLTLDNVWLQRLGGEAEVRVSDGTRLIARGCTFESLDWQATGGEISLKQCEIGGMLAATPQRRPGLHLWPDARWRGVGNRYGFSDIRVGSRTYTVNNFAAFCQSTNSDRDSQWVLEELPAEPGVGVEKRRLPQP